MKKFICISVFFLCLPLFSPSATAAGDKLANSKFNSETVYYGRNRTINSGPTTLNVTVATPHGVAYGAYQIPYVSHKGSVIAATSWSGTGKAPVLTIVDFASASNSNCPGIDTSKWQCGQLVVSVEVESDNFGCPWIATISATSTMRANGNFYTGPVTRDSVCPTVPVDTFDISWDPNIVKHETVLAVDATGGTVTSSLQTYLMESGSLCDKSKYDSRGAYCRFVGTGVTLSVLGCDDNHVQSRASPFALTDKALHDITVSVNTKNIGTGMVKATCNFQYILEQL
ncbi:DUF2544 domain-containing protein [Citrobacter sedlakii]